MKIVTQIITASVAVAWWTFFTMGTVGAQTSSAGKQINQWVEETDFQFIPNILQSEQSHAASVQGYFSRTPGFPLWLLMDMGGPLRVDKDHFSVNSVEKDADGVWVLDLSCADSVNGFFRLNFAVDSKNGEAVLKISTPTEGDIAMYQGKIESPAGLGMPDLKNPKRIEKAKETAEILARIIPAMTFTVKLNSELYGSKARIVVTPTNAQGWTPRKLDADEFVVICCEEQNNVWYVRLKIGEATDFSEEIYLDLAVDAWTAEVNYRMGMADQLRSNWRAMVDGRVVLSE